jgi:hypothetical protein
MPSLPSSSPPPPPSSSSSSSSSPCSSSSPSSSSPSSFPSTFLSYFSISLISTSLLISHSLAPTTTSNTGGFFNGGFTGGNAAQQQQPQKIELAMSHEPYGKLPDIPVPPARVKALPTTPSTIARPLTPRTNQSLYKLTPKSVKKLLIGMEQAASPSAGDMDQRYACELCSVVSNCINLVY